MLHLTKDEFSRFMSVVKENNTQHYAMFLLSYMHGLRVSEVINLTLSDIKGNYLTVKRLKGSETTRQILTKEERDLIQSLNNKGKLFPMSRSTAWRWIQRYGKMAGIDPVKCHPHILKHTVAHHGLDGGMKINELQKHLGHKNLNSTAMYLKVDSDIASQSAAKALGIEL